MREEEARLLLFLASLLAYLLVGLTLALGRSARRQRRLYHDEQGEAAHVAFDALLWPIAHLIER